MTLISGLVYSGSNRFGDLIDGALTTPAFTLMILGIIVILISFMGTCGSLTENYCLLMTFSCVVAVCYFTEVISLAFMAYYSARVESISVRAFHSYIDDYGTSNYSRHFVDNIQSRLGCCGAFGPQDFHHPSSVNKAQEADKSYPASCCFSQESPCLQPFNQSCPAAISDYFSDNLYVLFGVTVFLLMSQALPMVFAWMQANNTRIDYYRFV